MEGKHYLFLITFIINSFCLIKEARKKYVQ